MSDIKTDQEYPSTKIYVGYPGSRKERMVNRMRDSMQTFYHCFGDGGRWSLPRLTKILEIVREDDELIILDEVPSRNMAALLCYLFDHRLRIISSGRIIQIKRPPMIITVDGFFEMSQDAVHLSRFSVVRFPAAGQNKVGGTEQIGGYASLADLTTSSEPTFNHLMIDLETMGNKSGAVICAVGVVEFDIVTGDTGSEFYEKVSIQSCLDAGLKVDGSTIEWWLSQSDEARHELLGETHELPAVLDRLAVFLTHFPDAQIWGNSARFDLGILAAAYHALKMPTPWVHLHERDVRTLVSLRPEIRNGTEHTGTTHNALADCYRQIRYSSATYNAIMAHNSTATI